jgi:cellulose biosynthesis protein BcsQ
LASGVTVSTIGPRTVAVAGAGATNVKATVAVNLAVAIASLGATVELRDADPERHSGRALTGAAVECVGVRRGAPLEILATPVDRPSTYGAPPQLLVHDCAPRMDAETAAAIRAADAVVVAVDGSALSLRALDEVAATRSAAGGDAVLVLLTRALPRTVDRWSLVERLVHPDGVRLSPVTVPMGRAARRPTGAEHASPTRVRRATLYAPGTRAARAYAAFARELVAALGVEPAGAESY